MRQVPARNVLLALIAIMAARAEPTFHKDILPLLQRHCQECHRPGEVAPMSFMTYPQVRPWAKAIKTAVVSKKMPPWFADPHFGKFGNDASLKPSEIALLSSWVDAGAHEGSPAEAPAERSFADGWRLGRPDAVFELPQPVKVPASGTIDYMFFAVPTGFTEDRWIEAIEVRPTNRAVVHHAIVSILGQDGWAGMQYLGGYAPGAVPQQWKPGQARLIPAGTNLLFQMHYTANGKPATDRTRIGLIFAKHAPEQQIIATQALNHWFQIPPGAPDYRVDSVKLIPQDSYLVGMRAHMHLRGKSFEFRAVYPSGKTEVLLRIPKYDFNWQPYYYLEAPLKLPRGTRIECTAYFDNSANNVFNPDPASPVRWGEQSWEEMMIGWLDIAIPAQN